LTFLIYVGTRFGIGENGDVKNENMVCGFGDIAVPGKWIDSGKAECTVPPLNCTFNKGQCTRAAVTDSKNPTPPTPGASPGPSNPDYSVVVRFNFSLDGGDNWFPLNQSMQYFEYKPCRPICDYTETFAPFPLILLLLASLLFCLPPLALCIGSKQPLPMPPLEHSPEPDPPPPLIFKTIPTKVMKKIKRTKVTKQPKEKIKKVEAPPAKKKWDTVAAGQYIRGGKHVAVGWGKYGEAEHGEEILDGFEDEDESSEDEPDEEYETEVAVALAFDDVEEVVEMPQAPEEVPLPEIRPIEGIDLDVEETCMDKCQRCLRDWRWKWVVIFLIIIGLMVLAILLLIDEHERLDAEINARTYGLSGASPLLVVFFFLFLFLWWWFSCDFLFLCRSDTVPFFSFFPFSSDPECKLNPAISLTKEMSKILWIGEKPVEKKP